jgi:hypothetical protein
MPQSPEELKSLVETELDRLSLWPQLHGQAESVRYGAVEMGGKRVRPVLTLAIGEANELASQRLEEIKNAPRYAAIDTLYPGTVALSTPYVGYTRTTQVTHTGGGARDLYDYKTITVTVSNPRLGVPIKRTTMIAAY